MRGPSRAPVVALALVPIGTIGGHLAGYGVAGEQAGLSGGHSHLAPAAWLAAVVAIGALCWVAGARGPRRDRINLVWLAAGHATGRGVRRPVRCRRPRGAAPPRG